MTMKTDEKEVPVNCICGEPHINLDLFRETGVYIILCHQCDRMEHSSESKQKVVERWNKGIEKDKNSINQNVTYKNELYDGMSRWAYNISAEWYNEHGQPMGKEDIEDIISLFATHLYDNNI